MANRFPHHPDPGSVCAAACDAAGLLLSRLHDYKFACMDHLLAPALAFAGARHARPLQTLSVQILADIVLPGGLCAGAPRDLTDPALAATGLPLVTGESVSSLRFRDEACARIDPSRAGELAPYRIGAADIVLCVAGDHAGAGAIMPLVFDGAILSAECLRVTPDPTRGEPFYLNNIFHYAYRAGLLKPLFVSGHRAIDALANVPLALPPIDEQKRIAGELLAISAHINEVEHIHARLYAADNHEPPTGRERSV